MSLSKSSLWAFAHPLKGFIDSSFELNQTIFLFNASLFLI